MIEVIPGTQSIPAPEIEEVTVKILSSAAGHYADDRAVVAAELRREIVGEDAELLGRIRVAGHEPPQTAGDVGGIVIANVEQEVVIALASAVHGDAAQSIGLGNSRPKQNQLIRIAQNQWKLSHLGVFDNVAQRGGFGVDRGHLSRTHLDGGSQAAYLKFAVESKVLIDRQFHRLKFHCLESGLAKAEIVNRRGQA